jgi:heavy metal sensor kinase
MLTIKTKIILAYTLVFGITLCLFAFSIYQNTKEAETAKIDARLESHAAKIATELVEENDEPTVSYESRILGIRTESLTGLRTQVIDQSGKIIVTDSILAGLTARGWQQASSGRRIFEVLQIKNQQYRCLWIPVEINDQSLFLVQLAVPMSDVDASLEHLRLLFFTIIPLALLITALAAYFITRIAFRPIAGMVETARQITAKNLHRRLALPDARDEVRLLGETLNNMIERINAAFISQKQFIADASHEIRTPLTVICSELEFAEKRTQEASVKESIQTALSEIDRLAKLTDGLLLLAKLDASQLSLDLQRVRLDELLVDCVQLVSGIAEKKGIQLRINLQTAVELQADREEMKSIILNLLDNAVKYSNAKTMVTASLTRRDSQTDKVVMSIADQGPGIPASVIPDVFKRFYRVDSSRTENPGSGLGLAIVERLVELHGGNISVQSEMGKGTTFMVELPVRMSS